MPAGEPGPLGSPDPRPDVPTAPTALRFDQVTHRYGKHLALRQLDLEVRAGETLALLGPNGAGKSTAISLLLGLLRPESGRVEVLGMTPRQAVARGRVGAMLQTGAGSGLPPGVRVSEALSLVRQLYPRPAPLATVVERAGIGTLMDRPTSRLSGGQAQRVRFALAIAGDPDVVFLDEPTAAMDVQSRRAFWRMIAELGREGRTILFATHHLAEADRVADRVVVLQHGRVIADGPGATLKAAVTARTVRFVASVPQPERVRKLRGVTDVEVRGQTVTLVCSDADAAVRALIEAAIPFADLEVGGAGLEDAVAALTGPATHAGPTALTGPAPLAGPATAPSLPAADAVGGATAGAMGDPPPAADLGGDLGAQVAS